MKTWLITGISRGLGRALAEAALARGDTVVGTVREGSPELANAERLHVLTFEVAGPAAAEAVGARASTSSAGSTLWSTTRATVCSAPWRTRGTTTSPACSK